MALVDAHLTVTVLELAADIREDDLDYRVAGLAEMEKRLAERQMQELAAV
jgi:hypothetical protein